MKMRVLGVVCVTIWTFLVQEVSGFYNPSPGRWLSRDPIGEYGFKTHIGDKNLVSPKEELNLFQFVANDAFNFYDPFGTCSDWNCGWKGGIGKLTINPNCKGILSIWVIPEADPPAPATGGIAGREVSADGYVLNGLTYKIDGSTCVEIDCSTTPPKIHCCLSIAARCMGSVCPPYTVKSGKFGGPPKEPAPGSTPPIVR